MTDTSLSQGIVSTIQTYISIHDRTIQQELEQASPETSIPYERYFANMVNMIQGILIHNFACISQEDKAQVLKDLEKRGSRLLYTPRYLEVNLLLKSTNLAQLVEYVTYLTFIQYLVYNDSNVNDWLYAYARDQIHCSEEEVEYIQKRIKPLYGIVVHDSPSIADLDISYIEKTLLELACKDFETSEPKQYLLQRVRNLLVRISKYHPHILTSLSSEAEIIYSMHSDPLVRVMYQAVIVDQKM